jgi:hypothetical protein
MALSVAEAGVVLARLMGGLVFDDSDSDSDDENYIKTPSLGPFPTGAHDHKRGRFRCYNRGYFAYPCVSDKPLCLCNIRC